jgi:hypothetical protein
MPFGRGCVDDGEQLIGKLPTEAREAGEGQIGLVRTMPIDQPVPPLADYNGC